MSKLNSFFDKKSKKKVFKTTTVSSAAESSSPSLSPLPVVSEVSDIAFTQARRLSTADEDVQWDLSDPSESSGGGVASVSISSSSLLKIGMLETAALKKKEEKKVGWGSGTSAATVDVALQDGSPNPATPTVDTSPSSSSHGVAATGSTAWTPSRLRALKENKINLDEDPDLLSSVQRANSSSTSHGALRKKRETNSNAPGNVIKTLVAKTKGEETYEQHSSNLHEDEENPDSLNVTGKPKGHISDDQTNQDSESTFDIRKLIKFPDDIQSRINAKPKANQEDVRNKFLCRPKATIVV